MTFDTCQYCEGSGIRDWLSGAPCYFCNGTGVLEDIDPDDDDDDDDFEEDDDVPEE